MNKLCVFAAVLLAVWVGSTVDCSASSTSVKVTIDGVDYPLARPAPYSRIRSSSASGDKSSVEDPFRRTFGIMRWLNAQRVTPNIPYDNALKAADDWFKKYSGYGVIGHGEDVFTSRGAQYRREHRGR